MHQRPKNSLATARDDQSTIGNPEADADTRVVMGNFSLGKDQHRDSIFVGSILVRFKFIAG